MPISTLFFITLFVSNSELENEVMSFFKSRKSPTAKPLEDLTLAVPSKVHLKIDNKYKLPIPVTITDDFSLVWKREDFLNDALISTDEKEFWKKDGDGIDKLKSIDCLADIKFISEKNGSQESVTDVEGIRANICLCGDKEYLTGRFRMPVLKKEIKEKIHDYLLLGNAPDISIKCAQCDPEDKGKQPYGSPDFFFQADPIAILLAKELGLLRNSDEAEEDWKAPHGLLLISGATKSCKSIYTRSILVHYLKQLLKESNVKRRKWKKWWEDNKDKDKRRREEEPSKPIFPHFVSFEDPREKWMSKLSKDRAPISEVNEEWEEWGVFSPITAPFAGFNYTPRVNKKDVNCLKDARMDAMRQTPKCFLIGEIREKQDWIDAVELAGTGHLVVATTHAGSISECFDRLFSANKIKTEAERGFIARRMLGVVHLKHADITLRESPKTIKSGVFPRVWKQTPQSNASLVAVGLSSLIPNGGFLLSRSHVIQKYWEMISPNTKPQLDFSKKDPLFFMKVMKDGEAEWEFDEKRAKEWIRLAKKEVALDDLLNT